MKELKSSLDLDHLMTIPILNTIQMIFKQSLVIQQVNKDYEKRQFNFDQVFIGEENSQGVVFRTVCQEILEGVINGYNGTIMAYGQTGSGKTHTIVKEMLPSCAYALFDQMQKLGGELQMSAVQIYKEEISDLLTEQQNMSLRNNGNNFFVKNLHYEKINHPNHLQKLLKISENHRKIGSTSMNSLSSRSHAIYSFTLTQKGRNIKSVLNLVDLAGSERLKKAKIQTDNYEETISINTSLTALGKCIISLSDAQSSHIPYRDSKLTKLIAQSLGGNSKTALVVNLSPQDQDVEETLASLQFGQRAHQVINKPQVNVNLSNKDLVSELKKKIKAQEFLISELEYEKVELMNVIDRLRENEQSETIKNPDMLLKLQFDQMRKKQEELEQENTQLKQKLSSCSEVIENSFFSGKNDELLKNLTDQKINFETFKPKEEDLVQRIKQLEKENAQLLEQMMQTDYHSTRNDMNMFQNITQKNIEIQKLKEEKDKFFQDFQFLKKEKIDLLLQIDELNQKLEQVERKSISGKSLKVIKDITKKSKSPIKGYGKIYEKKCQLKETAKSGLGQQELNEIREEFENQIFEKETEIQRLKVQLEEQQKENKSLNRSYQEVTNKIDIVMEGQGVYQNEVDRLKRENCKMEEKLRNFENNSAQVILELEGSKKKIREQETIIEKLEEIRNERNYLHEKLLQANKESKKNLEIVQEQIDWEELIMSKDLEMQVLEKEIQKLKKKNEHLQTQSDSLMMQISEKDKKIEECFEREIAQNEKIKQKQQVIERQEKDIEKQLKNEPDLKEINELKNLVRDLRRENEKLKKNFQINQRELDEQIENLVLKNKQLKEQLRENINREEKSDEQIGQKYYEKFSYLQIEKQCLKYNKLLQEQKIQLDLQQISKQDFIDKLSDYFLNLSDQEQLLSFISAIFLIKINNYSFKELKPYLDEEENNILSHLLMIGQRRKTLLKKLKTQMKNHNLKKKFSTKEFDVFKAATGKALLKELMKNVNTIFNPINFN